MAKRSTVKSNRGAANDQPDLSYIAADLRPLAVAIDSLTPDPHNARLHGEKNRAAVAESLRLNGQLKPITVDADGVILTGNCTWETAKSLGWKYIARTRTELRGAKARAWAIQDNRTAELAEWDQDELQRQSDQIAAELDGVTLESLGFDEAQLKALGEGDFEAAHGFAPKKPPAEPEGGEQDYAAVFKIILSCPTEDFHRELIEALEKNTAGDAAAAAVLARLLKGVEFTAPNVT
jgi:ParB-like chromosome segregation protein Spo0J